MWDMDFILALGKTISLVVCMIFIEGVIASRPKAQYTGLILPVLMLLLSVWVYATWHNWIYFIMVFGPALLCWFIYYICRRSLRNGSALTLQEDEENL